VSATESEVDAFLVAYKEAVLKFGWTMWLTEENKRYLNDSGYTKEDNKDFVNRLQTKDYSSGPEPDDDIRRPLGEVWKFQKERDGFDLYIKLKLCDDLTRPEPVVCMSFHETARPMIAPLKMPRLRKTPRGRR